MTRGRNGTSRAVVGALVFAVLATTAPIVGFWTVAATTTSSTQAPAPPTEGPRVTQEHSASIDRHTTTAPPPVVGDRPPTDPNADGVYEDVNGDGVVDVTDADALGRRLNDSAVQSRPDRFDLTGDGRVTRADVDELFRAVTVGIYEDDADADRLPDAYEREIGIDPRDGDSDAPATMADEGGNGRIDGREDFDGDNVTTVIERTAGTDPFVADTDGDGLPDGYESRAQSVDPTLADTDGDGTPDGAEDTDGDGLDTRTERRLGTFPSVADSDDDGLSDATERAGATDPTDPDTDDDGLRDGAERDAGTDPTAADSDGDGTRDANETLTTTVTAPSTDASVAFTGEGNVAGDAAVINATGSAGLGTPGGTGLAVGPTIRVAHTREFESATVRLPYDTDAVDPANVTVVRYDADKQWFLPVDTTVDRANGTAVARVDEFSRVGVVDGSAYEDVFDEVTGAADAGSIANDFEDGTAPRFADRQGTVVDYGFVGSKSLIYDGPDYGGLFNRNLSRNFSFDALVNPTLNDSSGTADAVSFDFDLDRTGQPRISVEIDGAETRLRVGDRERVATLGPDDPLVTDQDGWNRIELEVRTTGDRTVVRVQRWQAGRERPDGWDARLTADGLGRTVAREQVNEVRVSKPNDGTRVAIDEYTLRFEATEPPESGAGSNATFPSGDNRTRGDAAPGRWTIDGEFDGATSLPSELGDDPAAELVGEGYDGGQAARIEPTEATAPNGVTYTDRDAAVTARFNREFNVTALVKSPASRDVATGTRFSIGIVDRSGGIRVVSGEDSDRGEVIVFQTSEGTRILNRSVGGTWYWYQIKTDYQNGGYVYLFRRWEAGTDRPAGWDARIPVSGLPPSFVGSNGGSVRFVSGTQPLLIDRYRIDGDESIEPGRDTVLVPVVRRGFEDGDPGRLGEGLGPYPEPRGTVVNRGLLGERALRFPTDDRPGEITVNLTREFRFRALVRAQPAENGDRGYEVQLRTPPIGSNANLFTLSLYNRTGGTRPYPIANPPDVFTGYRPQVDNISRWHWIEFRGDIVNDTFTLFARTWPAGSDPPAEYRYRLRNDTVGSRLADGEIVLAVGDPDSFGGGVLVDQYSIDAVRQGPVDTDNDGLTNRQEREGFPISPFVATRIYNPNNGTDRMNVTGIGPWQNTSFVDRVGGVASDSRRLPRVQTDPFDADTDGDGIIDGIELGERTHAENANVSYYTIRSDPSDSNTDEVGLNDSREYEIDGSNPLYAERLSIVFKYPLRAEDAAPGDETRYEPLEHRSGRHIIGATRKKQIPADTTCSDPSSNEEWLEGIDLECGTTYFEIPVVVSVAVDRPNGTAVAPTAVGFRTRGGIEGRQARARQPPVGFGTTKTFVVLAVPNAVWEEGNMGQLQARVLVPEESIFTRPEDDRRGDDRVITLAGDELQYGPALRVSAQQLRQRAANELYNGFMSAWSVYSSVYGIGMTVTRGSQSILRATIDDIANNGIKRFGDPVSPELAFVNKVIPANCVVEKYTSRDDLLQPPLEEAQCAVDVTTGLLKYYMNKRQGGVETEATIEEKTVEVAGDVYVFRAIVLTREN